MAELGSVCTAPLVYCIAYGKMLQGISTRFGAPIPPGLRSSRLFAGRMPRPGLDPARIAAMPVTASAPMQPLEELKSTAEVVDSIYETFVEYLLVVLHQATCNPQTVFVGFTAICCIRILC